MEEIQEPASVKQVALKWGLISGVIGIAFFLIQVFTGMQGSQVLQYVGIIPFVVIVILAHNEYKKTGDGFMSFGQGLGIGTLIALISYIVSMLFFYIYIKFIDSTYIEAIKDKQVEGMMEQGMSQQQIDQAMSYSEFFFKPEMMVVMAILVGMFFAFIITLIITIFTRKSNPEFDV